MRTFHYSLLHLLTMVAVLAYTWTSSLVSAAETASLAKGQSVYVPAYSHIYTGIKGQPMQLSITLSVRNTDPAYPITLTAVDYYDSKGVRMKRFISGPVIVAPLATEKYVITEEDRSGGSGANFIVDWQAEREVNTPVIETIMISTKSQLGISFTSRGKAIKEHKKE